MAFIAFVSFPDIGNKYFLSLLHTRNLTLALFRYRMEYEQHIGFVTTICQRYLSDDNDVEDAVQDTFVQAATSFGRFRHRGEGSFRAWLAKIAMTVSIRILRKRGRLIRLDSLKSDLPAPHPDECPLWQKLSPEVLHRMIRELPDGCRTVLNLYAFEEKSHKEIAALLGIREGTSASQYHHAKELLADRITTYLRRTQL